MRDVTLCYLVKEDMIVLARKKRGFAAGVINGYGGKRLPGESIEHAVVRELYEESSVSVPEHSLIKMGEIAFQSTIRSWNQFIHVYLVRDWDGVPEETEEMSPSWFPVSDLPFDRMWPSDRLWLPKVLDGRFVGGNIFYSQEGILLEHRLVYRNP